MQAKGLDEHNSWGQSMALCSAEGCKSQVRQRDASPRFGRGMQVPGLAEGCRSQVWQRGAVCGYLAPQQLPAAEGTSRQGSACLSSPGSANAPAARALEVTPKQAKSLSIGEKRPHRSGWSAWQRGFPPTRLSSTAQNHPVTPFLSQCFSAVCVYVNPTMFFRCACVRFLVGHQLWPRP